MGDFKVFDYMEKHRYEQVVHFYDPTTGLKGITVIHNTLLGPALGGTRLWNYANEEDALIDCLRLARGMSYKAAASGLNLGGGKTVLIGDAQQVAAWAASLATRSDHPVSQAIARKANRDGVSLHGEAETPLRRLFVDALPEHAVQPEGVTVGLDAVTPLLETRKGRPGLVDVDGRILYVEPLDAPPVLLLCGGGHVSLEVARLAHSCGFVVDVVDDREEFSNAGRFPMARHCRVLPGYENLVQTCDIGRRHFVAIITRGHSFDREALAQALTSHAQYVGMIGSRTKREQVYAALRKQGVPDAELAAVCCPIGLSIEAETPQQIAVSIVAELLAARAGTLVRLRFDD